MEKRAISESALYQRLRRKLAKVGLKLINGKESGWIVLKADEVVASDKDLAPIGEQYQCLFAWEEVSDANSN